MKKNVSILAIVLILVFTLSSFTIKASNNSKMDYNTCKEVLKALGNVNVSSSTENMKLTRSEFIGTVMFAMNLNYISKDSLPYLDVSYTDKYYDAITAAYGLGIISEAAYFRPDEYITTKEAAKILVYALGMDFTADKKGGYPYGYVAVAIDEDIMTNGNIDSEITYKEMYTVIGKFLDTKPYSPIGAKYDDKIIFERNKTILELYHGVKKIKGIFSANSSTNIYYSAGACKKGSISINDEVYLCEYSYDDLFGMNVEAFVKNDEAGDTIIYVHKNGNENDVLNIKCKDIQNCSGDEIIYNDKNNKRHSANISNAAVLYNGKVYSSDIKNIKNLSGEAVLIDNDRDNHYEVIMIKEYSYMYVAYTDKLNNTIIDKNYGSIKLNFDKENIEIIDKSGRVEFYKIKEGDILKILCSEDNSVKRIYIQSTENINSSIYSYDSEEQKITIAQKDYDTSSYFIKYYLNKCSDKKNHNFIVDTEGTIVASEDNIDETVKYGYLINAAKKNELGDLFQMRILCENGNIEILNCEDSIIFNGTKIKKIYDNDEFKSKIFNSEKTVSKQIIKYSVNENGNIRMIDTNEYIGTVDKTKSNNDNLTLFQFPESVYSSIWFNTTNFMFPPYFRVSENTKIFVVSNDENLDESYRYKVYGRSYFTSNRYVTDPRNSLFAYNVSDCGEVDAILLIGGTGLEQVTDTSAAGVIVKVSNAVDEYGTDCAKLRIFGNNTYTDALIDDIQLLKFIDENASFDNIPFNCGDFVRYNIGTDGHLKAVSKDFDYKEQKVIGKFGNYSSGQNFYYGKVYARENDMVNVLVENNPMIVPSPDDSSTRSSFVIPRSIIVYDTDEKTAHYGTVDEILPYCVDPSACDSIFIKTYDSNVRTSTASVVLYK